MATPGLKMTCLSVTIASLLGAGNALASPQQAPQQPTIQMAILLDTSNSMDGLIDQARQQLWQAVDEFSAARRNGIAPRLEVAVYEYGNSNLHLRNGYTRQVLDFTPELDQVSEALFSLTTDGGAEYCGYAIDAATKGLQWSTAEGDIKAIFIAGNEPFSQGPVAHSDAIAGATKRGITVNTIFAGDYDGGIGKGWQQGALLANGHYLSIDHQQTIVHVEAPQDEQIAQLNAELNQTYVPYGEEGEASQQRQQEQDSASSEISIGLLAARVKSKVSALYNNASWDLVDAVKQEQVDLDSLDPAVLPAPMQEMEAGERKAYVEQLADQRANLQGRIAELSKERDDFVAEQERATPNQSPSLDEALSAAIKKQGAALNYEFEQN